MSFYTNTFDNLDKLDKFLKQNFTNKLTEEEIKFG